MGKTPTYSKIGAAEARSMERALHDLFEARNPAVAIADAIERGAAPNATSFEQDASQILQNAGGLRLSSIPGANRIRIACPENGHLAHFVSTNHFPHGVEPTLLAVECSLNRLVCIADAISDGKSARGIVGKTL